MELFIVRHGETKGNILRIFQGQNDDDVTLLNEEGLKQAKRAGELLAGVKFDKILCSTLRRAKQTLNGILEQQKNPPEVEYNSKVMEINKGKFQGKPLSYFSEEFKKSGEPKRDYKPEGTESDKDVFNRAIEVTTELFKQYVRASYINTFDIKEENYIDSKINKMFKNGELTDEPKDSSKFAKVLLVSHGLYIKELINVFVYMKTGNLLERYHTNNTCMYRIKVYCPECEGKCTVDTHSNINVSFTLFNEIPINPI